MLALMEARDGLGGGGGARNRRREAFSFASPVVAWSQQWESNPQPQLYESCALPLSYAGTWCRSNSAHYITKRSWSQAGYSLPERQMDHASTMPIMNAMT